MIICPRCGFQAPDGSTCCPRCGYGRQPVPPAQQPVPPAQPSGSRKTGKMLLTILPWVLLIFAISKVISNNSLYNGARHENQTLKATNIVLSTELAKIRMTATAQTTPAAAALSDDSGPSATITPTAKAAVPALCKDKQMDIIRIAEVLDAEGFPYPDDYDPDRNTCIYRITDQNSFLNMDFFGYLSVIYDDNNVPNGAITEIYYKDNAATNEIITDWGAVALAFVDPATNALAASSLVKTARTSGYSETENFGISGRLDTDSMVYTIGVFSMEQILGAIQ